MYERTASALATQPAPDQAPWQRLADRLDVESWQPKRNPAVVEHEVKESAGSIAHVLYSPDSDEYLPLTAEEHFVWQHIDGVQTVNDLEVAYLGFFKTVGNRRIAEVLPKLKAAHFLDESPRSLHDLVADAFEALTAESRLRRLQAWIARHWHFNLHEHVPISAWMDRLTPAGGSLWATGALTVLSLLGIVAFGRLFGLEKNGGAAVGFVKILDSYLLGVIVLWLANGMLSFINEFASGTTLRAQGRAVPRFDVDLRYGLLACTADLRQICMIPVRDRVLVLTFGGLVELAIAGLLSLLAILLPTNLFFNVAALCYVRVFSSICPWFDTRGYRAAEAGLGMPDLRWTAISLFRARWWRDIVSVLLPVAALGALLRPVSPPGLHWRLWTFLLGTAAVVLYLHIQSKRRESEPVAPQKLTKEEVASAGLLLCGLIWICLLVWTFLGAAGSDAFQQGYVKDLSDSSLIGQCFLWLLLAVPILLVLTFLLATVLLLLMYGCRWLAQSEFWHDSERVATALWITAALVAFGPLLAGAGLPLLSFMAGLAAAACCAACIVLKVRAGVSSVGRDAIALAIFVGLLLLGKFVGLLPPGKLVGIIEPLCAQGAYAALCAFAVLRIRDDRPQEAELWALGAVALACMFGLIPAVKTFYLLPLHWPAGAASLLGAWVSGLTLAALTPMLLCRSGSKGAKAAAMWACGVAVLGVMNILELDGQALMMMEDVGDEIRIHTMFVTSLETFGLALLAAGAYLYHHVVSSARLSLPAVPERGGSDLDRIHHAFGLFVATTVADVARLCGTRAADRLATAFNERAEQLAWRIRIKDGQADLSDFDETEIASASDTLQAAVRILVAAARQTMGAEALDRTVTRVYDHLPWESRELATTYVFRDSGWAEDLRERPVLREEELVGLLKETLIFKDLDAESLDALSRRFDVARFKPGRVIVQQGDEGDRFYVVQEGTVLVVLEGPTGPARVLAHLHSGDYFGEIALLERCPRTATVRAATDTSVYVLHKTDFDEFVESTGTAGAQVVETISGVRQLRSVPIFRDLPESQITLLMNQLKTEQHGAGENVFEQGDEGDKFYIVRKGKVAILAAKDGEEPREVAALGPGEYFGEIALLSAVPRTATARPKTHAELWALDTEDFKALMHAEQVAVTALRQTASRRLIQLKRQLVGT